MADYAGAVAAMRSRFVAAWSETKIAYQNETPQDEQGIAITPWPPKDPFVYFEVIAVQSELRGAGRPGNQIWRTAGNINVHVFTPLNYGYPDALRLADQAGDIFRAQTFYRDDTGAKVICGAPVTDGGASDADNGNWFRVTATIPFEFFFTK